MIQTLLNETLLAQEQKWH